MNEINQCWLAKLHSLFYIPPIALFQMDVCSVLCLWTALGFTHWTTAQRQDMQRRGVIVLVRAATALGKPVTGYYRGSTTKKTFCLSRMECEFMLHHDINYTLVGTSVLV